MRTYPANSPQSAARIVALMLVADGHVSSVELDILERLGGYASLGISREAMHQVLQEFCEDLLQARHPQWNDACRLDPRTVGQLMAEVDDPALRLAVLRLCVAVAEADEHVADAESTVLVSAVENWGLQRQMLGKPDQPDERRK